jgi:glycosidase
MNLFQRFTSFFPKKVQQNMLKSGIFLILFVLGVPIHFAQSTHARRAQPSAEKGEVIYHVFQRSFYDSNGDRQGDLNGLRQKLGYLQDLGITSILLLPLYDADCYHNYFANDFEKIDAEFGTMRDYIALVKEVHRRGMKIYLDMETQYVAEGHKWWKSAVGHPSSPYADYLLFEDEAHTKPASIIFDLQGLHSFDGPFIRITTVNLKSKDVLDYNIKLFRYFVDPNKDGRFDDGADGFRLDHAMDHLDKKPTLTDLFRTFWHPLIDALKSTNPRLNIVAEQADWSDVGLAYFEHAGVDRMFGFGLQNAITTLDKQRLTIQADQILSSRPEGKDQIIFLENHDIDRFASVEKNVQKQKLAAAIQLLIGGVPSIYYGQEIGMTGKGGFGTFNDTDGNDIPRREAFEWYKSDQGRGMAFWYKNTGEWWNKSYVKPNDGISLEEQKSDPESLFNFYKKMIRFRQGNAALSSGSYAKAENDNNAVFSFLRQTASGKVLVAANLSDQVQRATLREGFNVYSPLLGSSSIQHQTIELKPYEFAVWQVK